MTDYGVTASGFIRKPFTAIMADIEAFLRARSGDDIDLSPHTMTYQMLEACGYEIAKIWDALEDDYYNGYIEFATGISLDHLAALLTTRRKSATLATGTVVLSRNAPGQTITVPKGTRVATQDLALVYQTTQTADLTDLSVSIPIVALAPGASGNVAPATITRLIDPISGVTGVSNSVATTGGADTESDEAFRYRVISYAPSAKATPYSIKAALIGIEGVQHVDVDEDLISNTIQITIVGGDDDQISEVIDDVRAGGILATWQRPTTVAVSVIATVSQVPSADAPTVQVGVKIAITAYLETLPIANAVIYSDLVRAILGVDGVDDILSMSASAKGTTVKQFGEALTIPAGQKAVPGLITISVV